MSVPTSGNWLDCGMICRIDEIQAVGHKKRMQTTNISPKSYDV